MLAMLNTASFITYYEDNAKDNGANFYQTQCINMTTFNKKCCCF
jgi:hypothetical protein